LVRIINSLPVIYASQKNDFSIIGLGKLDEYLESKDGRLNTYKETILQT